MASCLRKFIQNPSWKSPAISQSLTPSGKKSLIIYSEPLANNLPIQKMWFTSGYQTTILCLNGIGTIANSMMIALLPVFWGGFSKTFCRSFLHLLHSEWKVFQPSPTNINEGVIHIYLLFNSNLFYMPGSKHEVSCLRGSMLGHETVSHSPVCLCGLLNNIPT